MPYIPKTDREKIYDVVASIERYVEENGLSNGEFNYLVTCIGKSYLNKHGTSYNTIADVVKALECAKLEFYARVARPYEDKKIKQNGDVY